MENAVDARSPSETVPEHHVFSLYMVPPEWIRPMSVYHMFAELTAVKSKLFIWRKPASYAMSAMRMWEWRLHKLSKSEIYSIIPPSVVPRSRTRQKSDLIRLVAQLTGTYRDILQEAVDSKSGAVAEGAMDVEDDPPTTRGTYPDYTSQTDVMNFMRVPTTSEKRERYEAFHDATSMDSVKEETCLSCARLLFRSQGDSVWLSEIPNTRFLKPTNPHPAHVLHQDMLIVVEAIYSCNGMDYGFLCMECAQRLTKSSRPPLTLSNNMWIGNVPDELRKLTIPEQMLIAFHFPRCFVFKLFPIGGGSRNPDHLQRGIAGNVTCYEIDIPGVVNMLEGGLMPRRPAVLASVIAITFIGLGKVPRSWLKSTFRVRRGAVVDALLWLKRWNRYYSDITLSAEIIDSLPEDDVPDEIASVTRREMDPYIARKERESYVPDDLDEENSHEADGTLHVTEGIASPGAHEGASREGDSEGDEPPDVIPLQSLGVCDPDLTNVSANDMMMYALANVTSTDQEGGYAVRHGGNPVNTFGQPQRGVAGDPKRINPLAVAFPCLWPYGEGGIEADREVSVSFNEHVRWCLRYHDRRFATHNSFPFVMFAIAQKRDVMRSARIQMKRSNFQRDAALLSSITDSDVLKAQREEERKAPLSDYRMRLLKKHMYATASRVQGSDQMRAGYRSEIWATTLFLNPPSLWTTWNFCDLHDPLVQLFTGEEIDMDNFVRSAGPDKDLRARNVANNPYAAAKFFSFMVHALLECLLGITKQGSKTTSKMGLMGRLTGYYGVVEAQGRGTLHLHMLMWLHGAPTSQEMHRLLKDHGFRERVKNYIRTNIRSHHDCLRSKEDIGLIPRESDLAYARPPHPHDPEFESQMEDAELRLVRAQQLHTCKLGTCIRHDRHGNLLCKRRAPWPLADDDYVGENGQWHSKRSYGYVNAWVPPLMPFIRCNHDAKLVTNGRDTKDGAWYITSYSTKSQVKTHNKSALLARAFLYHNSDAKFSDDIYERNRLLLIRCCSAVGKEQEFSAPQVISHLMGWGDVYRSHNYTPIYWSTVVRALLAEYPSLRTSSTVVSQNTVNVTSVDYQASQLDEPSAQEHTERQSEDISQDETITLRFGEHGRMEPKSQVEDFMHRGFGLEQHSFMSFLVNTYEENFSKTPQHSEEAQQNQESGELLAPRIAQRRGRRPNERTSYLPSHPRHSQCRRVTRTTGHNTLPKVIGPFFPRNDDPDTRDFYCACMLALLKPWRTFDDLKSGDETWESAFTVFANTASTETSRILSGIQYYYECSESADRSRDRITGNVENDDDPDQRIAPSTFRITQALIDQAYASQTPEREIAYGRHAMEVARSAGLFTSVHEEWNVTRATAESWTQRDLCNVESWKTALKEKRTSDDSYPTLTSHSPGDVVSIDTLTNRDPHVSTLSGEGLRSLGEPLSAVSPAGLFPEQRRVYDIAYWHLTETLNGRPPPQLLMHVLGEGGVGKSRVIQSITELYIANGVRDRLAKAAFTGIAASLIGGCTLHTFMMLTLGNKPPSPQTLKKLEVSLRDMVLLIIDELSMLSKPFLARLSRVMCRARQNPLPFGGVNVMLFGDLHQFPPVVAGPKAPLYFPANAADEDDVAGRLLYEQFTTVVKLRKQVRVTDPEWISLLTHVRHGSCKAPHLALLRRLIITNPDCPTFNTETSPWDDAVLITSRHTVRKMWNESAIRLNCKKTGFQLFVSPANDTIRGRALTGEEQLLASRRKVRNKVAGHDDKTVLERRVELCVGMKVMVTYNINTELDIANGARGVITRIVLHENEPEIDHSLSIVKLTRPPAFVLVQLNTESNVTMHGLPNGVVPIFPLKQTYRIKKHTGPALTVSRLQLPITPAYAFTDYRAQGQTLRAVIIDIATPPSGGITPFNAYVQLSRSSGSSTIRLLRDFDDKLFTQHPAERLRDEDARLEGLDRLTTAWWDDRVRLASAV